MTGTEGQRAQYAAVLRAIADAVEASETIPVPHGYLTIFPHSQEDAAAFLRAIPLPWAPQPPGPGEDHFTFQADLGNYISDGIRLYVHAVPEHVAIGGEPKPVTVTQWQLRPGIAALLTGQPERSEGQ